MDKRIEIMIKHCSDNGLLPMEMGKSIIAAMQEYAEWMAKEAFTSCWSATSQKYENAEIWFNAWLEQFKKEQNETGN